MLCCANPITAPIGTAPFNLLNTVKVGMTWADVAAPFAAAKQAGYLALPSVEHFVLVSQRAPRVEVYTREGDGSFRFRVHEVGGIARLDALGAALPINDLYEGVFDLPGDD